MRLNQAPFTVLVFLLILGGMMLVYYRGLVANVHAVGQEADRFVSVLQMRGVDYA